MKYDLKKILRSLCILRFEPHIDILHCFNVTHSVTNRQTNGRTDGQNSDDNIKMQKDEIFHEDFSPQ